MWSACIASRREGGRGERTHVLLLADCEYAEGYECAPEERLAAGSLREAEEAPDVLTLCGGGRKCQPIIAHVRESVRA